MRLKVWVRHCGVELVQIVQNSAVTEKQNLLVPCIIECHCLLSLQNSVKQVRKIGYDITLYSDTCIFQSFKQHQLQKTINLEFDFQSAVSSLTTILTNPRITSKPEKLSLHCQFNLLQYEIYSFNIILLRIFALLLLHSFSSNYFQQQFNVEHCNCISWTSNITVFWCRWFLESRYR